MPSSLIQLDFDSLLQSLKGNHTNKYTNHHDVVSIPLVLTFIYYFTVQPPALSREELQAAEAEATFTIQRAVFTAVALYLCSSTYLPACPPQLLPLCPTSVWF